MASNIDLNEKDSDFATYGNKSKFSMEFIRKNRKSFNYLALFVAFMAGAFFMFMGLLLISEPPYDNELTNQMNASTSPEPMSDAMLKLIELPSVEIETTTTRSLILKVSDKLTTPPSRARGLFGSMRHKIKTKFGFGFQHDATSAPSSSFGPTYKPLPQNAASIHPVSLLYEMKMEPEFTALNCNHSKKPTFKYKVTVQNRSFTSEGGDNKDSAKKGAAMAANEAIFGIKYSYPKPKPTFPCSE